MCVPYNERTLQKQNSTAVYLFFDEKGLCNDYVKHDAFLNYINRTLFLFKKKPPKNKPDYLDIVQTVSYFVQKYSWSNTICRMCLTDFLSYMSDKNLFPPKCPGPKRGVIAEEMLYYHLAMITLDYIDYSGYGLRKLSLQSLPP
jgi:hypothetical protein